jgi:hypothetical protein
MARGQGRKKTPLKDLKPKARKTAKVKGGGIEPTPFRAAETKAGIEPQPFRTSRGTITAR